MPEKRICIVDDDQSYIDDLKAIMGNKFNVISFNAPGPAVNFLRNAIIDFIVLDLDFQGKDSGIDWIPEFLSHDPFLPIIIVSYFEHPHVISEALKAGATEYIHKTKFIDKVEEAIEESIDKIENLKRKEINDDYYPIVFASTTIKKVMEEVRNVAACDVAVMITGESGVGKNLIAQKIHFLSERKSNKFVTIHAPSLNDALFESELFGHEKGAFTGATDTKIGKAEYANKGTLFLDEITETSLANQSKLLRLVESKEYERVGGVKTRYSDLRIISATNRDLTKIFEANNFREDLYYRLNTYPIHIPPLRERPEDIPVLAYHLLEGLNKKMNKRVGGFTNKALQLLKEYNWPGNIRELNNILERAMIKAYNGKLINDGHFRDYLGVENHNNGSFPTYHKAVTEKLLEYKANYITDILKHTGGKVNEAAKIANISRQSLSRMIRELQIPPHLYKR